MTYNDAPFPVALRLAGKLCVVVGGGPVAARKVGALLESGAQVRVISPNLAPQLDTWLAQERFEHVARSYQSGDLHGAFLVIAATNVRNVNAAISAEVRERGILLNVTDAPDEGDFYTMATVRRGDVLLAASTGGDSPALSAFIKRKLDATFGVEYAVLANKLGELRQTIIDTLPPDERPGFWRALVNDETLGWLRTGDEVRFDAYVNRLQVERFEG